MGFIFTEVFWGILLIFIGLVIVANSVFGLHIPVFRVVLAFFLVYIGVSLLIGRPHIHKSQNTVIFDEIRVEAGKDQEKYDIVFGKGNIDLTKLVINEGPQKIEINTAFGKSEIRINPNLPLKMRVNSAFGGAKLPNGNVISLGDYMYQSPAFKEGEKYISIEVNVVFGKTTVIDH